MALTTRTYLRSPARFWLPLTLAAGLAVGLAACGKRGALDIPGGGATASAPIPAETSAIGVYSPTGQTAKNRVVVPSKEPFILDPLL